MLVKGFVLISERLPPEIGKAVFLAPFIDANSL